MRGGVPESKILLIFPIVKVKSDKSVLPVKMFAPQMFMEKHLSLEPRGLS